MKKSLLLLFALIMCGQMYAEHFKFMGIPIDGTIQEFEKMLIEKGITPSEDTSDNTDSEKWYEGNWLGEDAYIVVNTTPVSGTVFGVSITLVDVRDEDGNMQWFGKIYLTY